jgi:23S rRNA G2445 N2-methylase RlmL
MVFPGLEPVAKEEIRQELHAEIRRTGFGLVVFRPAQIDGSLLQLRTTEDLFLLAWGTDELSRRATDLDKIRRWTAREPDWDQLLRIHHAIRPKPRGKPTFRLVTQMAGEHGYRRADARRALAEGLSRKLPASWKHAEENAAVEIWLTIHDASAVCGVRLSDSSMRHRSYKLVHLPASLRPTVAASMAFLAELKSGLAILDPMCGAGTILAEIVHQSRQKRMRLAGIAGGDIDRAALRAAATNLRRFGDCHLAHWDAQALPLPDQSVDRLVCNPPFGKKLGKPEEMQSLYEALLAESQRVLRSKGLAVLLVSNMGALQDAARQVGWHLCRQLRIRILGQPAFLTVWRRP